MTAPGDPLAVRLYRAALRILPRSFRRQRGDAMVAMLAEEWHERSGASRGRLLVRAFVDLVWTAVATRMGRSRRREGRGGLWDGLGMDLRSALRSLARAPLFTVAAVLSLALGVGGVATVYAVGDRLMLRPLESVADPEGLVAVEPGSFSYPAYREVAARAGSFSAMAAHRLRGVALDPGGGARPRPVEAGVVTGNYFDVLGVPAASGRLLTPDDNREGAPHTVVLSHALWSELGASPDVVGSTLHVNGVPFHVIGVAAPGFEGLRLWSRPALWIPVESWPAVSLGRTPDIDSWGWRWISIVGRLRPGVDRAEGSTEARAIAGEIDREQGRGVPDLEEVAVVPASNLAAGDTRDTLRTLLFALAGVVALALLAAASNVANLLLARGTRRRRELAVRAALGARRFHLARLVAVESTLLVTAGLAAGFLLSVLVLRGLALVELPGGLGVGGASLEADPRLFALAAAILAVVTGVAGIGPAVLAGRAGSPGGHGPAARGSTGGRVGVRLRAAFVAVEVAVAVVLLSGTALFGTSMLEALRVDLGFEPRGLAVARVDASLFVDDRPAASSAVQRLLRELAEGAAVEAVSWSTVPPLAPEEIRETFTIVGRPSPDAPPSVELNEVGSGFFRAAGIPLVRGARALGQRDVDTPMAVINEAMAARYWPGRDPVGQRITLMGLELPVVAVAADTRLHGHASEPEPYVFAVLPDVPSREFTLLLRGRDTAGMLRMVQEAVPAVDGRLFVADVTTGPGMVDRLLWPQRMGGLVFLLFAGLATALGLTGVYGVVAYGVAARLREFGVRLTLGARPGKIAAQVLGRSLVPVAAGVVVGALASVALTRVAASVLFGVRPGDLIGSFLAAVLVLGMALLAAWLPARRAGRVDPARVLTLE